MNQTISHWKNTPPFTETGRTFAAIDHVLPPISESEVGFIIRGWFFDLKAPVSRPCCRIGDQQPLLLTYSCYRADVLQAFPSIVDSKFSGFMASFPKTTEIRENTIHISYRAKGEDTEVKFTLPIPQCGWLSQNQKCSVIAVVTDTSAIPTLCTWSYINKPELIVCCDLIEDGLHRLQEEFTIRSYPEGQLGIFLKTYMRRESQVVLFGDNKGERFREVQNVLEIGCAEPKIRVVNN